METTFAKFLTDKKIDSRRLITASRQAERLTRKIRIDMRAAHAAAAKAKKADGDDDEKKVQAPKFPSGRPVTEQLIADASSGKKLNKQARRRLLKAVNRVLELRKESVVEEAALFSAPAAE